MNIRVRLWAIFWAQTAVFGRNCPALEHKEMKVSDILRVKGNTLYTATADEPILWPVTLSTQTVEAKLDVWLFRPRI